MTHQNCVWHGLRWKTPTENTHANPKTIVQNLGMYNRLYRRKTQRKMLAPLIVMAYCILAPPYSFLLCSGTPRYIGLVYSGTGKTVWISIIVRVVHSQILENGLRLGSSTVKTIISNFHDQKHNFMRPVYLRRICTESSTGLCFLWLLHWVGQVTGIINDNGCTLNFYRFLPTWFQYHIVQEYMVFTVLICGSKFWLQ